MAPVDDMPASFQIPLAASAYPARVARALGERAPPVLSGLGNRRFLDIDTVAIFCSRACPGDLASETYDLIQKLRAAGFAISGGFHSPMERAGLDLYLRSPLPVVIGLARGLAGLRIPAEYRRPLSEDRLLLVSGCADTDRRVDRDAARERNHLLAALAAVLVISYAEPGGATESFGQEWMARGKPLFVLDSPRNRGLLDRGARPASARAFAAQAAEHLRTSGPPPS
jgi:predicted Rossmann fold nucleotide-binding protein DprA/Smf involved in DNA uptake